MRILHIGKYFPPFRGGMETYLRDLMVAQASAGLECAALVHQAEPGWRNSVETYTAAGQTLPISRAAVWCKLLFTPISPFFGLLLGRQLKRQQPHILHLHMPNVSVFWALLSPRARKIPWLVHWHADVPLSEHSLGLRLFYRLYRPWERALLRRSAAIIVTSQPYLQSSEPLREFRHKCRVIALGLDPAFLATANASQAQAAAQPGDPLQVLAIGRLTYYKGFEYLLRAVAQSPSVRLQLVGSGELEPSLRALVTQLNLADRVTLAGKVSDAQLAELFLGCDCLCLPSIERSEAFGLVLLEAMYFGKATIACDVPGSGMGWVVADGITGLLVPPQDVAALAESLGILAQQRDKLAAFGHNGRIRFDQCFHISQSAAQLQTAYDQVLAEYSRHSR